MPPVKSQRAKAPPKPANWADVEKSFRAVTDVLNQHDEALRGLNGGIRLGEHTPGIIKLLKLQMPRDPPWKPLVTAGNWDSFADYLMEPGGLVRTRGYFTPKVGKIAPVVAGTGTSILANLPSGYAPIQETLLPAKSDDSGTWLWAIHGVTSAGVLAYRAGTANATRVDVDGLQWYAGATQGVAAPPHQFDETPWPLRVQHGLDQPCAGLLVLGFRLLGQKSQNVGAGTPMVDWQDLGDGTLRINGVWGLQWGQQYELLVYLTPETEP